MPIYYGIRYKRAWYLIKESSNESRKAHWLLISTKEGCKEYNITGLLSGEFEGRFDRGIVVKGMIPGFNITSIEQFAGKKICYSDKRGPLFPSMEDKKDIEVNEIIQFQ
ncbi:hypothetical protein JW949_01980 [Candidatus Woesearchaeota archaeon]|nr:hypothetical protein [Candidatus Woesearchaeota archaeon]